MENNTENFDPVSYEQIRFSKPYAVIRQKRKRRKLKAWQTVLFACCVMAFFYLGLPGLLYQSGMDELGMTLAEQLYLLACSVVFVLLMRADFREVFPVRRPKAGGAAGVAVISLSTCLFSLSVSYLIMFFAADEVTQFSESMGGSLTGWKSVIFLILVSVLPPVCEEALNRGVVLSGLRNSIPNKTAVILISGAIFGLSHLYPYRMIAQTLAGCLMAWLVLKTGNIVYSALYHFLYNGTLTLLSGLSSLLIPEDYSVEVYQAGAFQSPVTVGIGILIYGLFVPLLIYTGCYLVNKAEAPRRTAFLPDGMRSLLKILIPTGIIIITGIAFILAGIAG